MAAERGADHLRLAQRQIVGLPDIVEITQLDHQMMDAVLAGLDEGEAVVARVEVKEIGLERPHEIVAEPEAENIGVERHDVIEPLGREHGVAHAERAGAEAGDRAPGLERIGRDLGAVERLQPVADRIGKDDQILDAALVGQRA